MEFKDNIKSRRSVRKFKPGVIPEAIVKEAITLASYAPSWKNTESTRFYLINEKEKIDYIAKNFTKGFTWNENILLGTDNLIIIAAKLGLSGCKKDKSFDTNKGNGYTMFDAGSETYGLTLTLNDLGLSSVILGILDYEGLHDYLKLENDIEVIALLPFGYPLENPTMPPRLSLTEIYKKL